MTRVYCCIPKPKPMLLRLFSTAVSAGFPSPADDYLEAHLDLNRYLINRPESTFFMRFEGEPMLECGLREGDLMIVDRFIAPEDKKIVVASIDGELVVRRLRIRGKRFQLVAENPDIKTISINKDSEFEIWGVITFTIRHHLFSSNLQCH
ncbi:MAG: hypothetical protein DCF19_24290 [Pseudanabaena frigida]|uniref:Peptidase S24/S26A/S26B/S26C domain-containing protein n=1 Tax=Pseudanabaena frigida TaxID=945775 RepID=A0A2W4VR20_9CYAN|nr:MAG: hypothetical protein DCF19_24290 [Pseudanabaena frigida]